ncbi:MAG: hypothetical protein WD509_01550 [Candidatus Paceibacterota bacterium]
MPNISLTLTEKMIVVQKDLGGGKMYLAVTGSDTERNRKIHFLGNDKDQIQLCVNLVNLCAEVILPFLAQLKDSGRINDAQDPTEVKKVLQELLLANEDVLARNAIERIFEGGD